MYWNGCNIWLNSCLSANWNLWPIAFVQVGQSISFYFFNQSALFYERIIFSGQSPTGIQLKGLCWGNCISWRIAESTEPVKKCFVYIVLLNMTESIGSGLFFCGGICLKHSIDPLWNHFLSISQVHILFGCHPVIFISIGDATNGNTIRLIMFERKWRMCISDRFLFMAAFICFTKEERAMSAIISSFAGETVRMLSQFT